MKKSLLFLVHFILGGLYLHWMYHIFDSILLRRFYFQIKIKVNVIFWDIWFQFLGGWSDGFCRYWYKDYNLNDLNFCANIGWMDYIQHVCIVYQQRKYINTNALMYERFLLLSHDQARHGDQKHFFSISFLNKKVIFTSLFQ